MTTLTRLPWRVPFGAAGTTVLDAAPYVAYGVATSMILDSRGTE